MRIETPRIFLPRTGQTTSYATGDDGDVQAGNPRATRFVDNGNGTISDRATGLQWVQDPSQITGFGTPGTPTAMAWENCRLAVVAMNAATYAGFADWRMPNILEAISLVQMDATPLIISPLFTNAAGSPYWTSTAYRGLGSYRLRISLAAGTMGVAHDSIEVSYYIRPVRGGRVNHV